MFYSLSTIYIQFVPFYFLTYIFLSFQSINSNKYTDIRKISFTGINILLVSLIIFIPLVLNATLNTEMIQNISNNTNNYDLASESSSVLGNIFGSIIGIPYTSYNSNSPTSLLSGYDKPAQYLFLIILFIYTCIFTAIAKSNISNKLIDCNFFSLVA